MIKARLAGGFTEDDFRQVISYKAAEWKGSEDWDKYLRPATLFASIHFENYLNDAKSHQQQPQANPVQRPQDKSVDEVMREEEEYNRQALARLTGGDNHD